MNRTCCLVVLLAVPALADQPRLGVVSLGQAQALVGAAVAACASRGYAVSAAVVDRSGVLTAFARNEQAGPHTVSSSQRKAFTAASLGRDTAELARLIVSQPEFAGLRDMHSDLLILDGGLPLVAGDERIGGIGVGGAPGGHLDTACAQAAIDQVLGGG